MIIKTAKPKHTMVFAVNIDSPNKNQVRIGNIINPVDEAMNLADQAEPVSATIIPQAYQKDIEVGTPIMRAACNGFSFHHSDKYCALS